MQFENVSIHTRTWLIPDWGVLNNRQKISRKRGIQFSAPSFIFKRIDIDIVHAYGKFSKFFFSKTKRLEIQFSIHLRTWNNPLSII